MNAKEAMPKLPEPESEQELIGTIMRRTTLFQRPKKKSAREHLVKTAPSATELADRMALGIVNLSNSQYLLSLARDYQKLRNK
jgi:hypothetical protein